MLFATECDADRHHKQQTGHSKAFKVFSFTLSVWKSHCSHSVSNINALYVNCYGIHTLDTLMFFFLLISQLLLCMLQSAVPFSMTCAFLPPQWVTVSLPLVCGCVIVCLGIVQ